MNGAAPTVSVLVPCFDQGQYLSEAVESVLKQSFDDFEILVGDDGSTTPETISILDWFARPKTTVYRFPHRGLAATRNALIRLARGTYLCALDADDHLAPQFFERAIDAFRADSSLSFVSCQLRMFGDEHRTWPDTLRSDLASLLVDDTIVTPALVSRQAVVSVGGYDEHMPAQGDEDWDLWLTLVEHGHCGRILDEVLFYYRRRRGSMCYECTEGPTHLALVEYMIRKHGSAYRQHVLEVLHAKDTRIADIRQGTTALERELTALRTTIASRRRELEAIRGRLERLQAARVISSRMENDGGQAHAADCVRLSEQLSALHSEYQRALAEVQALRHSYSWMVTRPLRIVYELFQRVGR
jgi:GT2 family glycosyltransferase